MALSACSTCAAPALAPPVGPPPIGQRVAVGGGFACAIGPSQRLACWGADPGTVQTLWESPNGVPVRERPARAQARIVLEGAMEVIADESRWCARTVDARVICAGGRGRESLAQRELAALRGHTTTAVVTGTTTLVIDRSLGVCAIDDASVLRCAAEDSGLEVATGAVEVVADWASLLVRTDDGRLRAFRVEDDRVVEIPVSVPEGTIVDLDDAGGCVRLAGGARACIDRDADSRDSLILARDADLGSWRPWEDTACALEAGDLRCAGLQGSLDPMSYDPTTVALPAEPPLLRGVADHALGSDAGCAITAEHRVLCWGRNDVGQSGELPADPSSRARIEGLPPVVALARIDEAACALDEGGALWCWGTYFTNGPGTGAPRGLAFHATRPVRAGELPPLAQIARGARTLPALTRDGRSIAIQLRGNGEPGYRNVAFHLPPPAVPGEISFAGATSCAIEQGAVWCTGAAGYGLRGDGRTDVTIAPEPITMPDRW